MATSSGFHETIFAAAVKRPPDGLGPIVPVDRSRGEPIHRQLYEGYRDAILAGRLGPGQRLPSSRALAEALSVSRIPVVTAFEQLVAEGYVESQVGSGSFVAKGVSRVAAERAPRRAGPRRMPPEPLASTDSPWYRVPGPFRVGQPGLDEFPAELWARLVARRARLLGRSQMTYGDPMGLLPLREALADLLRSTRSMRCDASQIMVVSGSQQGVALAGRALLEPGDPVWLEEPGYGGARDALVMAGGRPIAVPVDEEGLDVAAGIAAAPNARAVYVTPSHQYPLGMIMSATRRLQLLEWARRRGAWILEDDYDGEYRYDSQPVASLHGLDTDQRVLYVGTFSKVLFPAIRVGYVVMPPDLVPRFRRVRDSMDIFPATLYQMALHDFLREGHFARHIRRMRAVYAERRRVLVATLEAELGKGVEIVGDRAGMHLVVYLPRGARDRAIAERAAERGVSVIPLSTCYVGPRPRPGLVLGYGASRVDEIPDAVRRLATALAK
jgi:GntR family transcriptional regulator / MocR family aminotransferase